MDILCCDVMYDQSVKKKIELPMPCSGSSTLPPILALLSTPPIKARAAREAAWFVLASLLPRGLCKESKCQPVCLWRHVTRTYEIRCGRGQSSGEERVHFSGPSWDSVQVPQHGDALLSDGAGVRGSQTHAASHYTNTQCYNRTYNYYKPLF
jgi:hypothetical protein